MWAGSRGVREIIRDVILTKGASLHAEPLLLLRGESLRSLSSYYALLRWIAEGYTDAPAIAGRAEDSRDRVHKRLTTLQELGYVERKTAVGPNGGGQPYWRIADPYFRFWFRYVYPSQDRLARGQTDAVLEEIMADLPNFIGMSFQDACLAWVGRYSPYSGQIRELGSWWDRKGKREFDIVAVGMRGEAILLGACEWSTRARSDLLEELYEARSLLGAKGARAKLAVFARGFDPGLAKKAAEEDVLLVTADDLFKQGRPGAAQFVHPPHAAGRGST